MMKTFIIIIVSLSIVRFVHNSLDVSKPDNQDDDVPVFKATDRWQEIKPGQSIPPGLHVRVDLQTGMKEAKLLSNEEENIGGAIVVQSSEDSHHSSQEGVSNDTPTGSPKYGHSDRRGIINKTKKVFTRKELSEMLKNIRDDSPKGEIPLLSGAKESSTTPDAGTITTGKDDMLSMNELREMVTFHSDVESMLRLVRILGDSETSPEDMVTALLELEYHVHQIDNARDLDILGGLSLVVRLLNHSDNQIQATAALTLGAAMQGNPEVQEKAYTYQALPNLLNLLSPSSPEMVQRRALYGLGSLLRGNHLAVQEFISKGGIEWISTDVTQHTEPVVIKTITLLTDLLEFEELEERTYLTKSSILSLLSSYGWCSHVLVFLQSNNLQSIEKTIYFMNNLIDTCQFVDMLPVLEDIHDNLVRDDVSDAIDSLQSIIHKLKKTKDEL